MSRSDIEAALHASLNNYQKALINIRVLEKMEAETPFFADNSALITATTTLEDCTVRHSLNEVSADELEHCKNSLVAEEKSYHAAKLKQKDSELKLSGIKRRIEASKLKAEEEKENLRKAENTWLSFEIQKAEDAYSAAAENLKQSYLRIMACAKALEDRGNHASASVNYSAEIMVPAIGSDCLLKAMPGESRAGGYYFKEKRPVFNFGMIDIENELASAATAKKVSRGDTIKQIIASFSKVK